MNNEDSYLKYIKPTKRIYINHPETYRLASPEEIDHLNNYSRILKDVATFYENNLSASKIDYVFKDGQELQVLSVKYKRENFPHLTGINFAFKSATEKFNYLKNGNNETPVIIESENHTFEKLDVLHKIPELTKSNSLILTQIQNVKQAKNIGFSKGIKDSDNELLIALQNFQPEFYQPKSLLNLKNHDDYDMIPNNTVLGVFKENEIPNGIHVEPISLNKNSLNNIAITTEILIGMKKYADELRKQRIKERNVSEKEQTLESSKEKKHPKRLTVKVDPKARDITMQRMRDQGLER